MLVQVGDLQFAGNGTRIDPQASVSVAELEAGGPDSNLRMLERLREDKQAAALLQACREDAAKGRMTEPHVLGIGELAGGSFSPRFAVEQSEPFLGVVSLNMHFTALVRRKA